MKKIFLSGCVLFLSLHFSLAQSGEPDASFGNNGIVTAGIGAPFNYSSVARQVLVKTDGSIYIILDATFITKRLPDGSIDSSYGFSGYSTSLPLYQAYAALQADGKVVIAGSGNNGSFGIARINTNGAPDSTFGNNGMQTARFDGYSQANSVAIQNDGKIVVAGYNAINNSTYFAVARYNKNGSADSTFNGTGQVVTDFGRSLDFIDNNANAVAIQPDGKIVVGGYANTGDYSAFAICRYNTDGSLDKTFDYDGRQTTKVGFFNDIGYSLAIQNDGKIILAGYTSDEATNYFAVVRYNANGSADKSFNGDGKQTASLGSDIVIGNSVAIQSDDKIVVAGNTLNGNNNEFAVARFNTNGSPDKSFDNDGILTTGFSSSNAYAGSVAIQSDNKIVVAGYKDTLSSASNLQRFALTRYNTNGSPDVSFGNGGKLEGDYKQKDTRLTAAGIQSDGKIVAGGVAWNGSKYNFAVARYNTNGSRDTTFNKDGDQITDFGSSGENINSLAIQKDGKIVVAGNSDTGGRTQFAIARYNTNGSIDSTFNRDGKIVAPIGFSGNCGAVTLQNDGKIIVAGSSFISNDYDSVEFLVARFNADGTFDKTFGGDGKEFTDFGSFKDLASSVAVQKDGKIIAAGTSFINNINNFCLARYNTDGSPDTTFSHDGKQNNVFGSDNYFIESIAIQNDGKILAAGYSEGAFPNGNSFVIARYKINGDLDSTFSGDGFQTTPMGPGLSFGNSIALINDGRIAVGGTNSNYTIALYKKDGTPDSTFGQDGIKTAAIGTGASSIQSLAFADNKLYAVGNAGFPGSLGVIARYLLEQSGPLPVTFIDFKATAQNKSVFLQWKTANEQHLATFIIERSADENIFTSIGSVIARGRSGAIINYSTIDPQPLQGVNYYRLKITDADGRFTYSKIVAVNIKTKIFCLQAFPNPAKNILYIQASGQNEKAVFQIIDADGRKLKEIPVTLTGNTGFSISVNDLPGGIYNLTLCTEAKTETRVFIKQ